MLKFGPDFPGASHQLDGQDRPISDAYAMHQYYLQVVPTEYKHLDDTTIRSNQYSVTEHTRHVAPGSNRGLPGVFFFYEVSALHVQLEEYREGWIRFLTSVCAIVGGVFTVGGMLDRYVYTKTSELRGGAVGGVGMKSPSSAGVLG
uniref:Endoplasmic reticulum vesicle transporter C-terminal domain-containing protein n=1 Tax=Minutocellus polymorphus TaxID=265543 RepID=A0A7S0B3M3_9STRA